MTTIKDTKHYLVFDVESLGIHGVGFSVGGGLYHASGTRLGAFLYTCPTEWITADKEDIDWVNDNVPVMEITHRSPKQVRTAFWEYYMEAKSLYPDLVVAAECPWPVESNFLSACIADDPSRKWEGPYPLIDLSSIMFAADVDPLQIQERDQLSLPPHNPQADAHLSAMTLLDFKPD